MLRHRASSALLTAQNMMHMCMCMFLAAVLAGSPTDASCTAPPIARELSADERQTYHDEGYVIVRSMFSADEVAVLLQTIESDPAIQTNVMPMVDASGRSSKVTLWNRAGNNTYGHFARGRRWVSAATALIGERPYHFHTKVMLKEPLAGGQWEWHQDFGYWYQVGCLQPDLMLSSILAVDNHSRENGCMQLLARSHRLGRLAHGVTGEQAGADAAAVEAARARLPLVHAEMGAGDVLFTHSNLLHASAPNLSPRWRRSLIVAYNAVSNPPRAGTVCPLPEEAPLEPAFPDEAVLAFGPRGHAERGVGAAGTELDGDGADPAPGFLDHERNARQFGGGAR